MTNARPKPAILVLYHARGVAQLPLRSAIRDHLQCWSRHSKYPVIAHNFAFGFDWHDYRDLPIAAVILDTTALGIRWSPKFFQRKIKPLRALAGFNGPKLALPQDEFVHTDSLVEFLAAIKTTHVGSVAPPDVARALYRRVLPGASLFQKLTGYLEAETLATIEDVVLAMPNRSIDVGYRAWRAEAWLGSHGQLKVQIAEQAVKAAAAFPDLKLDLSLDEKDMLLGDDWYRFLAACKATLGVEGGASVLDRNGSLAATTRAYVAAHPEASFDQIRAKCFPRRDGELELFAISPRHLESCATRTTQLLVEGSYQGILRPNTDYLPIKRDFSNMGAVLAAVRDANLMEHLATSAYDRVVRSQDYTYSRFVAQVEDRVIDPHREEVRSVLKPDAAADLIALAQQRQDRITRFGFYEVEHLLCNRQAYDFSEDPHWTGARAYANHLSRVLRFDLSPD